MSGGSPRKRIEESVGDRSSANIAAREEAKVWGAGQVDIPPPGDWQPMTIEWYKALAKSGQSQFYESSDWHMAWLLASLIDQVMGAERPSGTLLSEIVKLQRDLLVTEGPRRNAGMELMRPPADVDTSKVTAVQYYRDRLKAG